MHRFRHAATTQHTKAEGRSSSSKRCGVSSLCLGVFGAGKDCLKPGAVARKAASAPRATGRLERFSGDETGGPPLKLECQQNRRAIINQDSESLCDCVGRASYTHLRKYAVCHWTASAQLLRACTSPDAPMNIHVHLALPVASHVCSQHGGARTAGFTPAHSPVPCHYVHSIAMVSSQAIHMHLSKQ